jgi:hypothetical protein
LENGEIAVSAEGKYLKADINRIASKRFSENEWFPAESAEDPTEIEIP